MLKGKGFNFFTGRRSRVVAKFSGVTFLRSFISSVLSLVVFFAIPALILGSVKTSGSYGLWIPFGDGESVLGAMWSSWTGLSALLTPVIFLIFLVGAITGNDKKRELNKRRIVAIFFIATIFVYIFLKTLYLLNGSDWEWTTYMFWAAWETYCSLIGIPILLFFCSHLIYSTRNKPEKTQSSL